MICPESECELLKKLAFHEYAVIRAAAARRISSFATAEHLDSLISEFRAHNYKDLMLLRVIDEVVYGES